MPRTGGKLIFHIFGALAEFERDLIRERTRAGLTAARARGRKGGHPRVKSLADPKQLALAKRLYAAKETPVGDLARMFKVSRATFYRYMSEGDTTNGAASPLGEGVSDR